MKLLFKLTLCFSTLLMGNSLIAQDNVNKAYLESFNKEWKNVDWKPKTNHPKEDASNTEIYKYHLSNVIEYLNSQDILELSILQQDNRAKMLNKLAHYRERGIFPINEGYNKTTPIFIDKHNTYCAVGHLMRHSGYDYLAREIQTKENPAYVMDITTNGVAKWGALYGFSLSELALIQVPYVPAWEYRDHVNTSELFVHSFLTCGTNGTDSFDVDGSGVCEVTDEFIQFCFVSANMEGKDDPYVNASDYNKSIEGLKVYNDNGLLYEFIAGDTIKPYETMFLVTQWNGSGAMPDNYREIDTSVGVLPDTSGSFYFVFPTNLYSWQTPSGQLDTIDIAYGPTETQGAIASNFSLGSFAGDTGLVNTTRRSSMGCVTVWDSIDCDLSPSSLSTLEPVPVEFISLTGSISDGQVVLQWQTASELNNSHFVVEKSPNGKDFSAIGTVKGSGTTNTIQSYSFIDENIRIENIYRLKQIDYDGKFDYSTTIVVEDVRERNVVRQSADRIFVELPSKKGYTLQVTDLSGKIIQQNEVTENVTIDKHQLGSGIFTVSLLSSSRTYSQLISL